MKPHPSIPPQLRRRLDRHFLTCSATVGATLAAAAAGTQEAKADIVYSGANRDISIPFNDFAGIYFDFDTGTTTKTNLFNVSDANLFDVYASVYTNGQAYWYHSLSFLGPNNELNTAIALFNGGNNLTLKLNAGQLIGPNQNVGTFSSVSNLIDQFYNYTTHVKTGPMSGGWSSGGKGYIGFSFVDANGHLDYGWMQLQLSLGNFTSQTSAATVIDWAYDNTGNPIATGQVPEPGPMALALLGGGALGLLIWRQIRRRDQQTTQK
jgi:PEP-CTERM motif-containing protein